MGAVRLHRLLEDARGVRDLIDDGREKLGGAYILDRRFVVSLVEGAMDLLGRMVFHARVLGADDPDALYAALDASKAAASRLTAETAHDGEPGAADWRASPEYLLLDEALRWLEEPGRSSGKSPCELLDATLDHAIRGLGSSLVASGNDRSTERVGHVLGAPLELVQLDGSAAGGDRHARYREALGEGRVALFGLDPEPSLLVEAALTGDPSADFLFVWSRTPDTIRAIVERGIALRVSRSGRTGWSYDLPTADLEATLVRLGENLLGAPS